MAPLADDLSLFGKMTKHPKTWNRGLELMQPFVAIRDRGAFPADVRVEDGLISAAIAPLSGATAHAFRKIGVNELHGWTKENLFFDLTDALRASPLKEDIPRGHLLTGMGYILGSLFLPDRPYSQEPDPQTKHFGTALAGTLSADERVAHLWHKTLQFNYGGLWVHLLWHAYMGRDDAVTALEPLCKLMSLAPVVGFPGQSREWLVLCPS